MPDTQIPETPMHETQMPILYSFRRCPYAMRARLAISAAGVRVELREVVLRAKPAAFLAASPSGTVPSLVLRPETGLGRGQETRLGRGQDVIDESLDIMRWALGLRDPQGWLTGDSGAGDAAGEAWIARCDGPFKSALDRTKYASRHPECDPLEQRGLAMAFLDDLDDQIGQGGTGWMFARQSLADMAIAPFVRQFANIDKAWFADQPWPHLQDWLSRFCASQAFADVMAKYAPWEAGAARVTFPH